MDNPRNTNRRRFLTHALPAAALLSAVPRAVAAEPLPPKSTVVLARDPDLRQGGPHPDPARLMALLDRALCTLMNRDKTVEALQLLLHPGEKVSLKVNTLGGRGISTSPVLAEAVAERLRQAGVRASDITVWDRDTAELERSGFKIVTSGNAVQCYGTDRLGYEDELAAFGSVGSRLSRILTWRTGLLINLPVLKDHDGAGVTLALKNMYGVIHNPNKYHPNGCDPYVADVCALPEIRSRMRLVLCDATTAMYEGGPAFKPEHSWPANLLMAARDPVAHDHIGWQLIEKKRAERGLKTLTAEGRPPRYIASAADAEHRLGHNSPTRIAVVEV